MSVAPDLPPVVRIPSRAGRTMTTPRSRGLMPLAAPRGLRLVLSATRPARAPRTTPGRSAGSTGRPGARPARSATRVGSAATPAARRCAEPQPIVPEAWIEPVARDAASWGLTVSHLLEWDRLVEESLVLGRAAGARRVATPARAGTVSAVRLTTRGRIALAAAAGVVAAVLVVLSIAGAASDPARPSVRPPASVLVTDGDTLWTIAQRVAPDLDPRREVAALMRLNHLRTVDVVPGQVIRTR